MPAHSTSDVMTIPCPAKVNLALSVGPPDGSGYHPIASWMAALTFGDTLTLRRLESVDTQSRYDIRFADDAPQVGTVDWPLEKDLAYRAHRALEATAGRALPIELTLRKRIPTGAGLGGGSSDAAGVLWAVNELFELGLSEAALQAHAAALGSDVVFLVAALGGEPAAVVTGFGERLQPVTVTSPAHLVLVLPALSCATGPVYQAFDEGVGMSARADESRVRALAAGGRPQANELFNDLADAACRVCPPLAEAVEQVATAAGRAVHITGSGAAMFVLAEDESDATTLARRISDRIGLATVPTRTVV